MGKVVAEGGQAPGGQGDVVLNCGNSERARAGIGSKGEFSMTVNIAPDDAATPKLNTLDPMTDNTVRNWADCELIAQVSGYTSESVPLAGNTDNVVQVAPIIVHPVATAPAAQNFTVSVASLEVPDKAKKAFEKGQQQAKKGRWAAACDYFKRATQVYPRYALAWLELGRAQAQQNSFVDAQQSFHHAVSTDSHLMEGYVELARVALAQKEWKELADSTEHLVEAYPNSLPQFWFFNGVANFNLGNKAQAEKSAERGLRLDKAHTIPQLEYLYGLSLAARGDYKSAAAHVTEYLHLAPKAADSQIAEARLAEIQKLANPPQQSQLANPHQPTQEVDFSLH